MAHDHSGGWARLRIIGIVVLVIAIACAVIVSVPHLRTKQMWIVGAVVQKNDDPRKQSPITGVEVTLQNGGAPEKTQSDLSGFFRLSLPAGVRPGQLITLQFRDPQYLAYDLRTVVGDEPYVIHLVPARSAPQQVQERPVTTIKNLLVRYSIATPGEINVGSAVKTFEVPNAGDIPCDNRSPCSPDGRWKAAVGSASLDAGPANVFENARVFCIAGPCPFTRIEDDHYTQGGRLISVSVLNWSDTTTFMFQAEVFHQQVSDVLRETYPVIFGQTFNFSLPVAAEGPSLEAELNGTQIVFALGPKAILSWAKCDILEGRNRSKNYRCELDPGYRFQ